MGKVKELQIDSTLWAAPSKLVNLLDFKPNKLSIQKKSNTENYIKVHKVRYENGGFYLIIDNLEGYFDFSNNAGCLKMLFIDNDQQNKYYQVSKEILKIINGGHAELKSSKEVRSHLDLLIKLKSPSLLRNVALGTFGELPIVFLAKVNRLYPCIPPLLKTFLRALILMTQMSLYLFSLPELIRNCIIFL